MSEEEKAAFLGRAVRPDPRGLKPAKPAKPQGVFELLGYLRCDLGKSDREPFRQWMEAQSEAGILDELVKLLDSGYLLKVGSGKEGPQASLSACDTGKGWDGYVLTAFAGDNREAMGLLVYKHHILLEGDWSNAMASGGKGTLR